MLNFDIPGVYDALDLVMRNYPDKFTPESKIEIDTLLSHCLDGLGDDSEKFLSTLFIRSLKSYIGDTGVNEHIYLKNYEISQIQLFDILSRKFPFVKAAHDVVNGIILSRMYDKSDVTILDIGIGQGTQICKLLSRIPDSAHYQHIRVVGIEPFESALRRAEFSIRQELSRFSFSTEFVGKRAFVEKLSVDDLRALLGEDPGAVIVNASLALHHIQSLEERDRVISCLRSLLPDALLLTEPNVDHFEPDFYRRFQNCYRHFYHVFQVIDRLDAGGVDKNGLKLFFGREIEDIIGRHNGDRYEKHEPGYRWVEKLNHHGFIIDRDCFNPLMEVGCGVKLTVDREGFLGFGYETEIILAVICATTSG
ncbi:MAG: hypothetical protein JXR39_05275 [Marinilabiliaceae bacterium]|nr:hypothetical protein [Marinilabiliaceae bacterium]